MKKKTCKVSELRSCVEVEVAVLGSPSLISLRVSVDVKHHERRKRPDCFSDSRCICSVESPFYQACVPAWNAHPCNWKEDPDGAVCLCSQISGQRTNRWVSVSGLHSALGL